MRAKSTLSESHPAPRTPYFCFEMSSMIVARLFRSHFDPRQLPVLEVDADLQDHLWIVFGAELYSEAERGRGIVVCEADSTAVHLEDGRGCLPA